MKIRDSLYKPFKHWAQKGAIWVYSDPHFYDDDCLLMDKNWPSTQTQIDLINAKVHKNDTLIILGDIGDPHPIQKLNGYKVLILGNHDKGVANYMKSYTILHEGEVFAFFMDKGEALKALDHLKTYMSHLRLVDNNLFDEVYEGPLFIGQKICLSHEPIDLPFGINIHGHSHNGNVVDFIEGEKASMNVCSNVIEYVPIRLDEILQQFKTETIHRITINNAIERKMS